MGLIVLEVEVGSPTNPKVMEIHAHDSRWPTTHS